MTLFIILIFAFKLDVDQKKKKTMENGGSVVLLRKLSDVIFRNPKKIKVDFISLLFVARFMK